MIAAPKNPIRYKVNFTFSTTILAESEDDAILQTASMLDEKLKYSSEIGLNFSAKITGE